jgi:hypothetical protein
MKHNDRASTSILAMGGAASILLALLLYVGAYLALVSRGVGIGGGGHMVWGASYRGFGFDSHIHEFFHPVHKVDRAWIRPNYWREDFLRGPLPLDLNDQDYEGND